MFLLFLSVFTYFQSTMFVAYITLFCISKFWESLIIISEYPLAFTQDELFPYVSETRPKIVLAVGTSCGLIYGTILLEVFFFICFNWHPTVMPQCNCLDRDVLLGTQREAFPFSSSQQYKTMGLYRGHGFQSNLYFFSFSFQDR